MVEAFHKTGAKTTGLRKYIGDTISSLIFWFPIYIIQLFVLYAFQLITMQKIFLAIIVALVITLIFGRFSCFLADLFEKYILHKKPQHTYVDPL
ncbi:hypothetical protein KKG31_03775 [Patescibacteria group bacterium]|nr:hypothetical protein [Patescibacteria group bacterium]MBU1758263.1 hypothetical protein [Patescibacteria group bacterium]